MQPGALEPSAWVQRWSGLVPAAASVLDVACGSGRHVRWFAARGARVTAIDRDAAALAALRSLPDVVVVEADIEAQGWPLAGRQFDAVVVTNYLWRALLPTLVASVAEGGVLIYETFARGNETIGRPSNPDFLLAPGELLRATGALRVIGYEDGFIATEPQRFVQRIAAVREGGAAPPRRYPL
ncbi:MAG TPA: class I SAM-dependent methyltransferase [Burkholderiaceae bacterium]|nr:class I SAM-dependent methyltransferase [Burkholderiaceae bacterium]